MMIDYSDHQPYRESSSTPVLDGEDELVEGEEYGHEAGARRQGYKITELGVDEADDYSPGHSDQYEEYDPQEHYDIRYGSGEH